MSKTHFEALSEAMYHLCLDAAEQENPVAQITIRQRARAKYYKTVGFWPEDVPDKKHNPER